MRAASAQSGPGVNHMTMLQRRSILTSWGKSAETLALLGALLASSMILPVVGAYPQFAWTGWVVLVPLFVVIRTCRPWAAAGYGALWGLCVATVVSQFMLTAPSPLAAANTPHVMGSLLDGAWESGLIAIVVPALYAGFGAWLTRRVAFSPFTLATMWIGVELIFAAAAPELSLFRTIGDHGQWSHWIVSFLGYSFISFFAAYVNSLIVETITRVPRFAAATSRVIRSVSGLPGMIAAQTDFTAISRFLGPHPARGPPITLLVDNASRRFSRRSSRKSSVQSQ